MSAKAEEDGHRRRIAIVCPRYGPEIGGGAEGLARSIAHLLAATHDVTVATSCALDYRTWADHFPPGESHGGPVRIIRFPVASEREQAAFDRLSADAYARPDAIDVGERWLTAEGPDSPALEEWIRANADAHDAIIVIPYLYASARAVIWSSAPTILVPCAHEEPPLRLGVFNEIFASSSAIVCNAPEELELVEERFADLPHRREVIGGAIDRPPLGEPSRFRALVQLDDVPYVACVGRIEPAKGTPWLIERLSEWRSRHPDLRLVLVGREHMEVPVRDGLIVTGFLDEAAKRDALAGAAAVVLPSPYESLSIVALEAWLQARPTLANAASPVLVGQSDRSGGGLWYRDEAEFHAQLDLLVDYPMVGNVLGAQGRRWAEDTTAPATIRAQWNALVDAVCSTDG